MHEYLGGGVRRAGGTRVHEAQGVRRQRQGRLPAADRAARDDGLVFMVAENSQYWPEVLAAVEMIDNGTIGEVLTAKAFFNMRKSEAAYANSHGHFRGANGEDSHKPWRYDLNVAGGGRRPSEIISFVVSPSKQLY